MVVIYIIAALVAIDFVSVSTHEWGYDVRVVCASSRVIGRSIISKKPWAYGKVSEFERFTRAAATWPRPTGRKFPGLLSFYSDSITFEITAIRIVRLFRDYCKEHVGATLGTE